MYALRMLALLLAVAVGCFLLGVLALVVLIPALTVLLVSTALRRAISGLRRTLRPPGRGRTPARPEG